MSRHYCQFFIGKEEAIGSDGIFILDGRNKLETMIQDCFDRMDKLKNVKPWYTGFRIMRSNGTRLFDNAHVLYSSAVVYQLRGPNSNTRSLRLANRQQSEEQPTTKEAKQ